MQDLLKKINRLPIIKKMPLYSGLSLGIATLISMYFLLNVFVSDAYHEKIENMKQISNLVNKSIEYPMLQGEMDLVDIIIKNAASEPAINNIHLLDYQMDIVMSNDDEKVGETLESEAIKRLIETNTDQIEDAEFESGSMSHLLPIIMNEDCLDCHDGESGDLIGVLVTRVTTEDVLAKQSRYVLFLTLISIVFILVSSLMGIVLAINIKSDVNVIIVSMRKLVSKILSGSLYSRGDPKEVNIDYRPLINELNLVLDAYTGYINNVPIPIMMIDKDHQIVFLNEVGQKLNSKLNWSPEKTIYCHDYLKSDICANSKCVCDLAIKNNTMTSASSSASPANKTMLLDHNGIPLHDQEGNIVGALEIITDQSEARNAMNIISKQANFQKVEVEKLIKNLQKLASGDLTLETVVGKCDHDTNDVANNFIRINDALEQTVDNLNTVSTEFDKLIEQNESGKVEYRGNADLVQGKYKGIISIVNKILDIIFKP
ncbi:MAG: hypothetical protein KAI81_01810, partial [Candidatus Marinimicrobia bacterium]|nr:hypothetical protein [Candidatus Neomarinimicrobiota bacterium]